MTETIPSEFEGRLRQGKDWREIVAWVGDLPPMPHVASRAIGMVEDPDTTAVELTELLSKDTALAARVLKIANSAMFSRQREINTLNQAIMVIGFKALKGVIVAATLRQLNKGFGPLEQMVWENSMCTAMSASAICKKLRKRYVEEIFLLGLLHSLGQIVLLFHADTAKEYKSVMEMIKAQNLDYVTAEDQVLGFAHPLVGALVAKKWNFSAETCQIILHYKDQLENSKPETEMEEKTAIVQLADLISHAAGIGSPENYGWSRDAVRTLMAYVGFDAAKADADFDELVEQTKAQFQNEASVYS